MWYAAKATLGYNHRPKVLHPLIQATGTNKKRDTTKCIMPARPPCSTYPHCIWNKSTSNLFLSVLNDLPHTTVIADAYSLRTNVKGHRGHQNADVPDSEARWSCGSISANQEDIVIADEGEDELKAGNPSPDPIRADGRAYYTTSATRLGGGTDAGAASYHPKMYDNMV